MEWLWLPHEVTWRPQRDTVRDSNPNANDGTAPSAVEPKTIKVFLDPKTVIWAQKAFNVEIERQPYLLIGTADEVEQMVKGDVIEWGSKKLVIEAKPIIYRPGDGYDSGEAVASVHSTGGRG